MYQVCTNNLDQDFQTGIFYYFLFDKDIKLIYDEPDNVTLIHYGLKNGDI